jgi:membrane protease YdiL (CAAX protease family)
MDDTISNPPPDAMRSYGLFALALSLLGVSMIACLALVLSLGLSAAGVYLLFGWPYLHDLIKAGLDMTQSSRLEDLTTAGLVAGSAVYLAGIVGLWAMARWRAGRDWRLLLAWTPFRADRAYWWLLLAAMAYGLGASLALGHLNPSLRTLWAIPDSPLAIMAALALVVILAPLSEELLFRGWLYTALRARHGFPAALWATALLFAVAHWDPTHLYALAILPIGLVLGYVRERTGSAGATTLFHMIYNSSGLAVTFLGKV